MPTTLQFGIERAEEATTLLSRDHERILELADELADATRMDPSGRAECLLLLAAALSIHRAIEEELFYPAFREASRDEEDLMLEREAEEAHHLMALVLQELQSLAPSSPAFAAKARILRDLLERHIEEEEEEMFSTAEELMEPALREELGERLFRRSQELLLAPA